ncbi:LOW QUALITY PROTEIN: hypothetical protein M8C21_016577 [Ambrosia artemisiifolia]|uniref:Transposase, Ptta/En/Spm, plant n=1 Tax=Ambrosia artemisiifolia TaxID=4212 RepID=A0AAD5GLA6_AMBAR|nr:LOW QUALITY PROTEIN: hypothetical protein M8C21_016577 [Ambrosia artemisiifolia]
MMKKRKHKGKVIITYDSQGVPIGDEATDLSTFEGMVARSMMPITYATWRHVSKETKEELWQYVLANYVVDPKSRKQTIESIGDKWRNFKHTLYKDYIEKDDPVAKNNLFDPPQRYPSIQKSEWKVFVSQRTTKEWEERSRRAKEIRAQNKYNHHLSRKGYAKLKAEIMQETGKTEEEIDRATLWKKSRVLKSRGYDKDVQVVVDKIDELMNSPGSEEVTCGARDVLAKAMGTKEPRGHKKFDQRFNKLEDEVDKLKRGANYASEVGSCQFWDNEDVENDAPEEPVEVAGKGWGKWRWKPIINAKEIDDHITRR